MNARTYRPGTRSSMSSEHTVRQSRDVFYAPTPPTRTSSLHAPSLHVTEATPTRSRNMEEERSRKVEEKKAIAREKGKLRQRRKRARDKAAKETAQANDVFTPPDAKTSLTTSTLLTIPCPPISQPTPSPTASSFYSPIDSAESTPFWSPVPSIDPLAPTMIPLSTPIMRSAQPFKRRKSEPELEEYREDDRPKVRRTISEGVIPVKPVAADLATEFASTVVHACHSALGKFEAMGVSRGDIEGMRGAFASAYDQWRTERGMGQVALSPSYDTPSRGSLPLSVSIETPKHLASDGPSPNVMTPSSVHLRSHLGMYHSYEWDKQAASYSPIVQYPATYHPIASPRDQDQMSVYYTAPYYQ